MNTIFVSLIHSGRQGSLLEIHALVLPKNVYKHICIYTKKHTSMYQKNNDKKHLNFVLKE